MNAGRAGGCGVAALILLATGALTAGAGTYTVIDLTPPEFGISDYIMPSGISGMQQVGQGFSYRATQSQFHAILWNGSAESWVDLHPAGFTWSKASGIGGSQQVGSGSGSPTGGHSHALIWYGTAESCVDLHPVSGYAYSAANGTNGIQQVGWGKGPAMHALLWSGTAETCIDLNPSGFLSSNALGISETQQVGWGWPSAQSHDHALLWYGTAESYVDLHPTSGLVFTSVANGAGGDQQVGGGQEKGGSNWHAFLWTGTAESCVDLNPVGFDTCMANATNGTQQVGFGRGEATGDKNHALVWNGSADSYVDLHQFLPSEFVSSCAVAIDDEGNILGYADTAPDGILGKSVRHVFLWVPEPASMSLLLVGSLALLRRDRRRSAGR